MISVIIPTLNEEEYLPAFLSQFSDELIEKYAIQLIVSDSGSRDKTVEIARRKAHVVLTHNSSHPLTIAENRNLGALKSSGEILCFFNADVQIPGIDDFFRSVPEALKKPAVVAVTCPCYIFPQEEKMIDRLFHLLNNALIWFLNVVGIGSGRGECQVVKRDFFFRVGGYNKNYSAGEDFDLYQKLRRLGEIKFLWSKGIFESPRRYRKLGYGRVAFLWLLNAIWILIFRKSFSGKWPSIR